MIANPDYFNVKAVQGIQGIWKDILENTQEKNEEALRYHVGVFTKGFRDHQAKPVKLKGKATSAAINPSWLLPILPPPQSTIS